MPTLLADVTMLGLTSAQLSDPDRFPVPSFDLYQLTPEGENCESRVIALGSFSRSFLHRDASAGFKFEQVIRQLSGKEEPIHKIVNIE